MTRGSIKHDHSKLGIVKQNAKLQKNRKSMKRKAQREEMVKVAHDLDACVRNLRIVENSDGKGGALVPFKRGKLIPAEHMATVTPPPHQSFKQSRTPKKMSQREMGAAIRVKLARVRTTGKRPGGKK